jgi:hypothetical protein
MEKIMLVNIIETCNLSEKHSSKEFSYYTIDMITFDDLQITKKIYDKYINYTYEYVDIDKDKDKIMLNLINFQKVDVDVFYKDEYIFTCNNHEIYSVIDNHIREQKLKRLLKNKIK